MFMLKMTVLHGFNSQPPEGGWQSLKIIMPMMTGFNSQPPEGGWAHQK